MIRQHSGQFLTGLWFSAYPTLLTTEAGTPFKYRRVSGHTMESSIGNGNLEYSNHSVNIMTTYQLPFVVRSYVLLGDVLFIIQEIAEEEIQGQAQSLIRKPCKRFTMTLTQVDNGKEVSRV